MALTATSPTVIDCYIDVVQKCQSADTTRRHFSVVSHFRAYDSNPIWHMARYKCCLLTYVLSLRQLHVQCNKTLTANTTHLNNRDFLIRPRMLYKDCYWFTEHLTFLILNLYIYVAYSISLFSLHFSVLHCLGCDMTTWFQTNIRYDTKNTQY